MGWQAATCRPFSFNGDWLEVCQARICLPYLKNLPTTQLSFQQPLDFYRNLCVTIALIIFARSFAPNSDRRQRAPKESKHALEER